MKSFKFRFESVETLRKRKEDDALQMLGRARAELKSIQDRKVALQSELQEALRRRENLAASGAGAMPDDFAIEESFISGTRIRIRHAELQEFRAVRVVEKATRGYLHARRDLMVIQTLREKDLQAFKKERARREMKEADEVASIRAIRERSDS